MSAKPAIITALDWIYSVTVCGSIVCVMMPLPGAVLVVAGFIRTASYAPRAASTRVHLHLTWLLRQVFSVERFSSLRTAAALSCDPFLPTVSASTGCSSVEGVCDQLEPVFEQRLQHRGRTSRVVDLPASSP